MLPQLSEASSGSACSERLRSSASGAELAARREVEHDVVGLFADRLLDRQVVLRSLRHLTVALRAWMWTNAGPGLRGGDGLRE